MKKTTVKNHNKLAKKKQTKKLTLSKSNKLHKGNIHRERTTNISSTQTHAIHMTLAA